MNIKHTSVGNKNTLGAIGNKSEISITLSDRRSYNMPTFYITTELAEKLVKELQEAIEYNKNNDSVELL